MINEIHSMRNVREGLFSAPTPGNALKEYDPEAQSLVERAAACLILARAGQGDEAARKADDLTRRATAELLRAAGGSVDTRFALMVTARLVELEAELVQVRAASRVQDGSEGRS
ncbi:hypothetical protein OG365_24205 [Streptomyces sp. NBC_00853]|uniref:hypothetical protein n=1 Tax=Streptomyces sp. NBC_00853 TaxID=2903681 RepID=UPI0038734600|nr:hypothetical protein OG365_24205 [Streptomyces sp. NBC_00853]